MHAEVEVQTGAGAGQRFTLQPGQTAVLGRGEEVSLLIADDQASRKHTALELTQQGLVVTDLGSRNGTLLDGAPLTAHQPRLVEANAVIEIGEHRIALSVVGLQRAPRVREEFECLQELGQGATGRVFAARHRTSGRMVAIKSFETVVAPDPRGRERFLREAGVRIESPYVVQVYDVRIEGPNIYTVMELVQGRSLREIVLAGPLPIPNALVVGEQVALALAAAHAAGVVHRDVKPANILLDPQGVAKLADFGLAKLLDSTHSLTTSGHGMGTLAYVAPEQAESAKAVSPAADLYGLGATLYHLIAGRPPFPPKSPDIIRLIFEEEPKPLWAVRKDCPKDVSSLIHRLLEKHPADRPKQAASVAQKLKERRQKHWG